MTFVNQKPKRYIWPVGSSETGLRGQCSCLPFADWKNVCSVPFTQWLADETVPDFPWPACHPLSVCGTLWIGAYDSVRWDLTASRSCGRKVGQHSTGHDQQYHKLYFEGWVLGVFEIKRHTFLYPQISKEVPENSISANGRCFDFSFCKTKKWSCTAFWFC